MVRLNLRRDGLHPLKSANRSCSRFAQPAAMRRSSADRAADPSIQCQKRSMKARLEKIVTALAGAVLAVSVGFARAEAPSKAPVVIGFTADLEGYAKGLGLPWSKVADVWVNWINDKGGIL